MTLLFIKVSDGLADLVGELLEAQELLVPLDGKALDARDVVPFPIDLHGSGQLVVDDALVHHVAHDANRFSNPSPSVWKNASEKPRKYARIFAGVERPGQESNLRQPA